MIPGSKTLEEMERIEQSRRDPQLKQVHDRAAHRPFLKIVSTSDCKVDVGRPYLLKGLIYPAELSVWYGPPGCGKTFLAQHIAHGIEQGRSVLGRRVQPASSLYLALEGEGGFNKRMAALNQHFGPAPGLLFCAQPLNLFADPGAGAALIDAIKERGVSLVIVDTLSRSMSGGNENAPEDMTKMIGAFDQIRAQTGAHVMVIHHSGKDIERGGRGHNSLKGAVDVEVEVSKTETGERIARLMKARDDMDGQTFGFVLKPVDLGQDTDGDPISTCVIEECTPRARDRASRLSAKESGWLRDIRDAFAEPQLAREIQPAEGMPMVRAISRDDLRVRMQRCGRIESKPGEALTATERSLLRHNLNALRDKGQISMSGDWIWLQ